MANIGHAREGIQALSGRTQLRLIGKLSAALKKREDLLTPALIGRLAFLALQIKV
jgi:hypothetical protein